MQEICDLKDKGTLPKLAVILVGDDPASQVYVNSKCKQCVEVGIVSLKVCLPATCSQQTLEEEIAALNQDASVHGILLQLPLPKHLDTNAALECIWPEKDVDGVTTANMGKLMSGDATALLPCTPQGIRHLIRSTQRPLTGMRALVIGRSRLVGIPTAHLLLQENCTVTLAHSYSRDLPDLCHQSDIIIAACGQPQLIQGSWLKSQTIVIDVGIHRLPSGELVGDVAASTLQDPSIYLSPVPGGVGPLTVAFLLKNTVFAAKNK